ncbi:MAG: NHLP family bacteriocin export ABC transporter peptidase/permease/ATPase subunit [Candidatus Margulisiibacteriota bacterium]
MRGLRRLFDKTYQRAETPLLLQMEAVECGAAALGIILAYYGHEQSLETLRLSCGVSRDGSKASNIIRAAHTYGLDAKAIKKENLEELAQLPLPFVVFWNFNHFLVVEGFCKTGVFLNDPARGHCEVTWDEFNQAFTGIILLFAPGHGFRKKISDKSFYQDLKHLLAPFNSILYVVAWTGFCLVIPGILIPVFSRVFVDQILVNQNTPWLLPLLWGMVATLVLQALLTWVQRHYLVKLERQLSIKQAKAFLWHILHLPVSFFMQRFGGEIGSRLQLVDRMASILAGQLAPVAVSLLSMVFFTGVMLQYDVVLTLISLLFVAINMVAFNEISKRQKQQRMILNKDLGKVVGTSIGGIQGIETLKSTGREQDFFATWSGYQANVMASFQGLSVYSEWLTILPTLLTGISVACILLIGGFRVLEGHLTLGMLVAFQGLNASLLKPATDLINVDSVLQQVEGDVTRLNDVLKTPMAPEGKHLRRDKNAPSRLAGKIEFRNVSFGYSPLEAPLIESFSLSIEPGQRVALVGGSGSGKSTISKLLAGLYTPWSGEILIDDTPIEHIPTALKANSLAMVDQDIFLFEGTIRENLILWDNTLTEPMMIQAAKDACIHDDSVNRPHGYDTIIEDSGRNFSGGQRQRFEIARALVIQPTLLILDEATSALDPVVEKEIDANIRRRGCTCLIVSHRLSTIRDADLILVLDKGKVVQQGTHETLSSDKEGAYARLISQ